MAVAPVQQKLTTTTSNPNPTTVTFTSSTTTGNLLSVVVFCNFITITGVTDNKGNTFTLDSSSVNYSGTWSQYHYICPNATGGASHTISVATSSTGWMVWAGAHEFSGADTASVIESTTGATGYTSTTPNTNPTSGVAITTTNANDYVMGLFDATTTTTFTAATGWTLLNTGSASKTICTVGAAQTSTGTYTPQVLEAITGWAGSTWSLAIKAASTGGTTAHSLAMLGVGA